MRTLTYRHGYSVATLSLGLLTGNHLRVAWLLHAVFVSGYVDSVCLRIFHVAWEMSLDLLSFTCVNFLLSHLLSVISALLDSELQLNWAIYDSAIHVFSSVKNHECIHAIKEICIVTKQSAHFRSLLST